MSEELLLESTPVAAIQKERIHLDLRQELNEVSEVTESWIQRVVQLAKTSNILYYPFTKILARILRKKNLVVEGYHTILKHTWHSAA